MINKSSKIVKYFLIVAFVFQLKLSFSSNLDMLGFGEIRLQNHYPNIYDMQPKLTNCWAPYFKEKNQRKKFNWLACFSYIFEYYLHVFYW